MRVVQVALDAVEYIDSMERSCLLKEIESQKLFIVDGRFYFSAWRVWRLADQADKEALLARFQVQHSGA